MSPGSFAVSEGSYALSLRQLSNSSGNLRLADTCLPAHRIRQTVKGRVGIKPKNICYLGLTPNNNKSYQLKKSQFWSRKILGLQSRATTLLQKCMSVHEYKKNLLIISVRAKGKHYLRKNNLGNSFRFLIPRRYPQK